MGNSFKKIIEVHACQHKR